MSKDEMKNRISMALKDPVLQQGFEIICKENAELKGEASSVLDNWCKGDDPCPHLKKRDSQLAKAKELLKKIEKIFYSGENAIKRLSKISDVLVETEQFLKEEKVNGSR